VRLVVDTNILVSGLLKRGGPPGRIVEALVRGQLELVYSQDIIAEYDEILSRPKFALPTDLVTVVMESVYQYGSQVSPSPIPAFPLPDPDDWPFVAVALTVHCPIVTGNLRHFPTGLGVEILTPAQLLKQLANL
jgi:uncharacterized protein